MLKEIPQQLLNWACDPIPPSLPIVDPASVVTDTVESIKYLIKYNLTFYLLPALMSSRITTMLLEN